jgi:hypothetical protein
MKVPARLATALVVSALATSLGAATASAQTLPLTLEWTAPPQCPTADDVRREVVRQAHVQPGSTPPTLDADARVESVGRRWRVELRTTRAGIEGYQTLEDESCELLARATALVLALALYDPGDAAPSPTPAPEAPRAESAPHRRPSPPADAAKPAPAPAPAAAEPEPPPLLAAPQPRPSDLAPSQPPALAVSPVATSPAPLSWGLTADSRLSRGPLPDPNLGLSLGLDARRGRWLAKLRLVGGVPTEQASAAAPDVRGRYQAWGASLGACVVARPESRLALAGCAEVDASLLVATASGAAVDGTAFAPWYAAGPAALARIRVSRRARLELGVGLGVSIDRPRFALRHLGDVYEVPRLAPNATLGISVQL